MNESNYPSLNYAHDEIKEQVDFQIGRIRRYEATVGILVGISVTAMSIIMSNSSLIKTHLYLTIPTIAFFTLTVLCGMYAMWHIGYYRPVDPVAEKKGTPMLRYTFGCCDNNVGSIGCPGLGAKGEISGKNGKDQ